MPKIRSITYFANLSVSGVESTLQTAAAFLDKAAEVLSVYEVQTRRFASQPFPQWLLDPTQAASEAQRLFGICNALGIAYLSLGPVGPADDSAYIDAIADIFTMQPGVFATTTIADSENGVSLEMVSATAKLIDKVSRITSDGMTNLYLTALANCEPGSPFFPVAYHDGGDPMFALAIQAADLAVAAFQDVPSPSVARERLTASIQRMTDELTPLAEQLAADDGVRFGGFDFSLAPYPTDDESLGGALEALAGPFGSGGMIAAASLVMTAIELANFKRIGFCGLMLPVLEDSVLGLRAAEGKLHIQDLLMLSAICGTGLDCIPLAGDIGTEALETLLLDIASLAIRLNKPLTARLMPFPDKQVGDDLTFEFEYFANSKVMDTASIRHFNFSGDTNLKFTSRC